MLLELPKRFKSCDAEIVKNELLIYSKPYNFNRIICQIVYTMRRKVCIYCGENLKYKWNRTLDHKYPKATGGANITNNIFFCCTECNRKKMELLYEEYMEFKNISGKEAETYLQNIRCHNEDIKKKIGFKLPKKWVIYEDVDNISDIEHLNRIIVERNYKKIYYFYSRYANLPYPIIVDKNNYILDGYKVWRFAKQNNIRRVPVIKLDNVRLIKEKPKDLD